MRLRIFCCCLFLYFLSLQSGLSQSSEDCLTLLKACEDAIELQDFLQLGTCASAYKKCKEEYSQNSEEYARALINLASIQVYMGNLLQADSLLNVAGPIMLKQAGEKSRGYGVFLNNKASVLGQKGQYIEALKLVESSDSIMRELFGPEHIDYGHTLNVLGIILMQLGQHEKGRNYLLKALDIQAIETGTQNIRYANRLGAIGAGELSMGNYQEARKRMEESKAIFNNLDKTNTFLYLSLMSNMSSLYLAMGQYDEAERTIQETLRLLESMNLQYTPLRSIIKNNHLMLLMYLGQIDELGKMAREELELIEKYYGKNNLFYPLLLDKLIFYLKEKGENDEAIKVINEALPILKQSVGAQSLHYPGLAIQLSDLYLHKGQLPEALENTQNILEEIEKRQMDFRLLQPMATNILSFILLERKEYEAAKEAALNSLKLGREIHGTENASFPLALINVLFVLDAIGDRDQAVELLRQFNKLFFDSFLERFQFLTEKEKLNYLNYMEPFLDYLDNFLYRHHQQYPELASLLFSQHATLREALLDNTQSMIAFVRQQGDSNLVEKLNQWNDLGQVISRQYSKPFLQRDYTPKQLDSLSSLAFQLERSIIGQSLPFRHVSLRKKTDWLTVRSQLKADEAIVDFFQFHIYRPDQPQTTDSTLYAALVGRKDFEEPKLVFLFKEETLEQHLTRLTPYGDGKTIPIANTYSKSMYRLIWEPLDSLLRGAQTVYYMPDELLHKISFDAIPVSKGKFLSDQFILNRIGSVYDIDEDPVYANKINSALLYSAISYGDSTSCLDTGKKSELVDLKRVEGCSEPVIFLKNTEKESNGCELVLKEHQVKTVLKKGCEADEDYFKTVGTNTPSPGIIHLPTHGMFCKNRNIQLNPAKEPEFIPDPLFQSSLALAGYNRKFYRKSISSIKEDGELFAAEVADLNLFNTQLVILSACVSGLGESHSTEGVFGFQRAFKRAGARQVLVSLWEVDDLGTAEFMRLFYQNWFSDENLDTQGALRKTQQQMRQNVAYASPYYWAAFVLM